eukprot:TRINITY_DN9535_c0_g1_i1.p1 TRINITY_DN9535_c0_g1~~TRINITY_DN9535_c0_g1_i1.p1  ORF type:complete len:465 (+),score=113.26 TRINITY_DN9535_c0_g1_i1:67-1395(+)
MHAECAEIKFSAPRFDFAPARGQYIGTLRWDDDVRFPPLPAYPTRAGLPMPVLHSWEVYLKMRHAEGEDAITVMPQQLDALSFPLTIAACLRRLERMWHSSLTFWAGAAGDRRTVHCVLAGASAKTEQRILDKSSYWEELAWLYPHTDWHLHFVGPEIQQADGQNVPSRSCPSTYCAACGKAGSDLVRCSQCKRVVYCDEVCQRSGWKSHKADCKRSPDATAPGVPMQLLPNLKVTVFRGTVIDFFLHGTASRILKPTNTIVVGMNTGFGCGNKDLMLSWVPDIRYLLTAGFLCINSCANTWGDFRGEQLIMGTIHLAEAKLPGMRNPFRAMTVILDEKPDARTGVKHWHCANYCCYAYQGFKSMAVTCVGIGPEAAMETISNIVPALARYAPLRTIDEEEKSVDALRVPEPKGGGSHECGGRHGGAREAEDLSGYFDDMEE